MKEEENNLRHKINDRIISQLGGDKGISIAFAKLRDEEGWTTPQPLYNVKNGKANLTSTTLHDLGMIDENFSADMAIFGEYRFPTYIKEMEKKIISLEQHLQKGIEETRRAEMRAERAESLNEVLQKALKEQMKINGVDFN